MKYVTHIISRSAHHEIISLQNILHDKMENFETLLP